MNLTLTSYNMHVWNNGQPFLEQLCHENDVIFVHEHWLLPQNLDVLLNLSDKFSAHTVSGIIDIEAFAHKDGRPYGGLGVLWSKNRNIGVKYDVIDIDFFA